MKRELVDEIKGLLDRTASDEGNIQHLIYVLDGYRSFMLNMYNPYALHSARYESFQVGWNLAGVDYD